MGFPKENVHRAPSLVHRSKLDLYTPMTTITVHHATTEDETTTQEKTLEVRLGLT